jgi:hypothetical protein
MYRLLVFALLSFATAFSCNAQSPEPAAPSPSDPNKSAPSSAVPAPASPQATGSKSNSVSEKDKDTRDRKTSKKVWTNDEINHVNAQISVVGDVTDSQADATPSSESRADPRGKRAKYYRDQLRQCHAQLGAINKKLDELRNFKANNSSSSGGIDPRFERAPSSPKLMTLKIKHARKVSSQAKSAEV